VGKASRKRKEHRHEFFNELAVKDPKRLRREVSKRLGSWIAEARKAAKQGFRSGSIAPTAFDRVDYTMAELRASGELVMTLEGISAREAMVNAATQAVARALEPRLYQLRSWPRARAVAKKEVPPQSN